MFNEPNETVDRSSSSTLTREISRAVPRFVAVASSQPLSDLWLRYGSGTCFSYPEHASGRPFQFQIRHLTSPVVSLSGFFLSGFVSAY